MLCVYMLQAFLMLACLTSSVFGKPLEVCSSNQFSCLSGQCINQNWRCDGIVDCNDGSDEDNCKYYGSVCSSNQFSCLSGQCINQDRRCDGFAECDDSSDEDNCKDYVCSVDKFSCLSGDLCIDKDRRCNGRYDCNDKSDEDNCKDYVCLASTFSCLSGDQCIWPELRCNGYYDCNDTSDEDKCKDNVCPSNKFSCLTGQCIEKWQKCDGENNCNDGSDENNCKDDEEDGDDGESISYEDEADDSDILTNAGCLKENDIEYLGNDINSPSQIVGGVDECADWCRETQACQFWSLRIYDNKCSGKTSDSGRRSNYAFISGSKECATGCFKENYIEYLGNIINSKIVGGEVECANWCGGTQTCKFWTLRKSDNKCWIETSDSGRRSNNAFISGSKGCATGISIHGGPSPIEGNVFYKGRPICDDNWDNNDAEVVCRMLGYRMGTATIKSAYGNVDSTFSMDEVQCYGNESSILDCSHSIYEDCDSGEGAGIICEGCFTEPDYMYTNYDLGAPVIQAHWKACRNSAVGVSNAHYWTFRFSDRLCWLMSSNRNRKAEGKGVLISGNAGCGEVCSSNQFSCQSGECIYDDWRCDGIPNCDDSSDEDNCKDFVCPVNKFSCLSGQCLYQEDRCDGFSTCDDGSDEENCKDYVCPADKISCLSGQCIEKWDMCDGENNCNDGSDENNCKIYEDDNDDDDDGYPSISHENEDDDSDGLNN